MTPAPPDDPTPVVLLHGWGGSYADTWRNSALERAVLDGKRRLVECDLPGHGARAASHDPADYADIAGQLDESLSEITRFDAVGFSLGGKLLLHIASIRPGRIRRLVVAGVGENIFRPEAGDPVAEALLGRLPPNAPDGLRAVIDDARNSVNDPHALAAVIRRRSPVITPLALDHVDADTLLIAGSADGIAGSLDPLARAMPSARVIVIQGLSHLETPASPDFWRTASEFIIRDEQNQ